MATENCHAEYSEISFVVLKYSCSWVDRIKYSANWSNRLRGHTAA